MKKFFASVGMVMAAIISLVSCQVKEAEAPTRTLTITASSDLTKTANDGLSTLWAEGDQLHVFYLDPAVLSHASYVKAGVFTLSDGAGSKVGSFTGEAASVPSAATTWYAIYTGSSSAVPATPAASADGDGFIYLGRSNGIDQSSYDDMSKVSGSHCPLYGVTGNVPAGGTLGFTMKQLASVIEFNVVNGTSGALVINSLQLNEMTDVAGQYYLNVTGSEPVLTAVEGRTVTNPLVRIQKPAELAAGESAKIYIPVKPFVHAPVAGMSVEISGSLNGKVGSKTIYLNPLSDAQCTFAAGKIKKVTVNVEGMDAAATNTVSEALTGTVGDNYLIEGAVVTLVAGNNVFATDDTGTILVYNSKNTLVVGDVITIDGKTKAYNNLVQFSGATVTKTGTQTVSLNAASWTDSQMAAAYGDAKIAYVSYTAYLSAANNGVIPGSDAILYLTKASGVSTSKEKRYTLTGYVYGWMNYVKDDTTTPEVMMYVDSATEVPSQESSLTLDPSSLSFEQEGGSESVTVTSDDSNWTVDTSTVPDWLTVSKTGSGLTVSASANEESKRTASVTITHSNGTLTATLKVTQAGAVASDAISLSPASLIFEATSSASQSVTVTSNNSDWTWDAETVAEWITLTKSGDVLTVSVTDNTGSARNCTVKVLHANGTPTANLVINQRAPETGDNATFTKVTSGTVGEGDYLIVFESDAKALDGSLTDFSKENWFGVTINGSTITTKTDHAVHFDPSDKTLKTASGYYLGAKGNNSNGMNAVQTIPSGSQLYAIQITVSDGVASIGCSLNAGLHLLKWNAEYSYFRFYKPSSSLDSVVAIYKKN